jgi:starch-binding outer membrane protein, SusD/RagB family
MNRSVLALSLTLVGVAGCKDWLTGPGLTVNPNSPVGASAAQQLVAVQASAWTRFEGQLARNASIWTQQIIGSNNQQLMWATQYQYTEDLVGSQMTGFYTGGGLVGMRNVQSLANAGGDPFLEGLGKIWEGFSFGTAASIWGDLPYSEAVSSVTSPKLDAQLDIYTAVQTKLDEGITLMQSAPSTGNCEPADVVYCAAVITRALQITRWVKAANTIKARYYLHLAERNGAAAYALALAAANKGIDEVPTSANNSMDGQGPGDFRSWHGATLDQDGNIWAEFLTSRLDLAAGDVLVQVLKAHCPTCAGGVDPRLSRYFDPVGGVFTGKDRNNNPVPAGATASGINTAIRRALTYRQPMVTWAENQLIIAEASCVPNVTTNPPGTTCTNAAGIPAALAALNAVRTSVGLPALAAFSATPLVDIMTEKYIVQYQNIDVWNDFKRTCLPSTIRPYSTATEVPGRMNYTQSERNANANIPAPNVYPVGTSAAAIGSPFRNWNDPNACP